MDEKIKELKIQAFDIREKLDILNIQRENLLQEYNNIIAQINSFKE